MRIIAILTLALLSLGCSNGPLTRDKASELLESGGVEPVVDVGTRGKQATLMRLDIWVPDNSVEGKPSQLRVLSFLTQLKSQGFLQGPQTRRFSLMAGEGTDYLFHAVPSPDAEEFPSINQIDLQITLARSYFGEVTGVTQNGNEAEAEVLLKQRGTAAYEAITKALNTPVGQELRGDEWAMRYVLPQGWSLTEQDIASASDTTTVRFRKFDEGWRVE